MRKAALILFICIQSFNCFSQYWQQQVNYEIEVKLNDQEKTLDAFEKLTYYNNSPDTLHYIWFHLWPNAYKNDKTAFSDQLLINGNTQFYFAKQNEKGYINQLDFKVNGITAQTEDHPLYIDVIKVNLPTPVAPGHQITITTPFHEKLPFNFSRGGYDGFNFQITQWYPKPAVYDKTGWHPMPYLDQGEFYSEFGNFDVKITAPSEYVIAATGMLQDVKEIEWLKQRSHYSLPVTNKSKQHITQINKNIYNRTRSNKENNSEPVLKTIEFKQDHIHDFAWFANKNFIVIQDTCHTTADHIVNVYSYFTKDESYMWDSSLKYIKDAIHFYSTEVGAYPFSTASIVLGSKYLSGGMEYPTIASISPALTALDLDETIAHELGHNWFYGMLATNERDHPWMDEGINTFYQYEYIRRKYGDQTQENEILFQTVAIRHADQPIELSSEQYSATNYQVVVYHKTAEWLKMLQSTLGNNLFRKKMHEYLEQWKFRHPYPDDFKAIFTDNKEKQIDSLFLLLNKKGILPNHEFKGFKVVSPIVFNSINNYLLYPTKNILGLSPALGANFYDKLIIGALITNYKLPPNRFNFLAIPMYGTGSKKFNGLGKLNYTFSSLNRVDLFVNAARFSMNELTDSAGNKYFMNFTKLVPGIKLWLHEKDRLSTVQKYIQWKTYFINEQTYQSHTDTLINNNDTSLTHSFIFPWQKRYLNQLKFVYENFRALYPFDFTFQIEQSNYFVRPTITANYFFNYAKGGGLQVRFFAGKFAYINGANNVMVDDRYFLNMTGSRGYEDYTYSDYFIGRNEFDGISSHQLMIKDGGFKVGTDLLIQKVGKTDNWLTAINFNSTLPDQVNPLQILPIPIHLSLFLDIGTFSDLWQTQGNERFLYDAGLQVPLLKGSVQIYIPIIYSKIYSDYYKSYIPNKRFLKSISFSINLFNKDLEKMNHEVQF